MESFHFNKEWQNLSFSKITLAFLQVCRENDGDPTKIYHSLQETNVNLNDKALEMYNSFCINMINEESMFDVRSECPEQNVNLINYAESNSALVNYQYDNFFARPKNFVLRYHLPFIEQSLGIRLSFFVTDPENNKALKIRSDLFMDNFIYNTQNCIRPFQIRLVKSILGLEFHVLRDSFLYDPAVQERFLHHKTLELKYDFRYSGKCHFSSFREEFLVSLLSYSDRQIFCAASELSKKDHVCDNHNKVCYNLQSLEILYRQIFQDFNHSISFVSYLGQKWFFSEKKPRISVNDRKRECYISSCMIEEIFRYDPPRKDQESEIEFAKRISSPCKYTAILSDDGFIYLARKDLDQWIDRNKPPTVKSLNSSEKRRGCDLDKELLEISDKINNYIENMELEKKKNMGQEGFLNSKKEKEFKCRLHSFQESMGKNFRKHCSVCSDSVGLMRQHPVGKTQKLYTIPLSSWSLLKTLGFKYEDDKAAIDRACKLSMACFDIESRNVDFANKNDYKWSSKRPLFDREILGNKPKQILGYQKPLYIGYIDGLLEDPTIFSFPEKGFDDSEIKIWHMIENFVCSVMKRQILLCNEKVNVLNKYFSFLRAYHQPVLDFFLEEHGLTESELFAYNDYEKNPFINILEPMEELFFTDNIQIMINRMKSIYKSSHNIDNECEDSDSSQESSGSKSDQENIRDSDMNYDLKKILDCITDIKKFWDSFILGQLQSSLIGLCRRIFVYAYNLSSYDGVIIQSYVISTQKSGYVFHDNPNYFGQSSRGNNPRFLKSYEQIFHQKFVRDQSSLSQRLSFYYAGRLSNNVYPMFDGLKVKRIPLNKSCVLLDAMQMTGKGFSLDDLAKTVGLSIEKGEFPYEYVKTVACLKKQLPLDPKDWESSIGKDSRDGDLNKIRLIGSLREITEAEKKEEARMTRIRNRISRAYNLYSKWKCINLGCFMKCYLKLDCLLLMRSLEALKNMLCDILNVDFLDSGSASISSYANFCIQTYLFEHKRYGFREVSNPLLYSILKSGFLGGILNTNRFYAGKNCPKKHVIELEKSFKNWSCDKGRKRKMDYPNDEVCKKRILGKQDNIHFSY